MQQRQQKKQLKLKQKKNAIKETSKKAAKKRSASSAAKKGAASVTSSGNGGIFFVIGLILFIIFCFLAVFICIVGSNNANEEQKRQNISNGTATVSESVLQYSDLITQYANDNGIGRYVALIEAIMMQESGGVGTNVMQVNFGSVTTVEDSIRMGVGYVRTCLEMARVTDPNDMDHIKVALQGYNYGTGYITWVWNNYNGVYSEENAQAYSDMQKASLGWGIYGDPQYVPHVLRYYSVSSGDVQFITDGATFAWPVPGQQTSQVLMVIAGEPYTRASTFPTAVSRGSQSLLPVPEPLPEQTMLVHITIPKTPVAVAAVATEIG